MSNADSGERLIDAWFPCPEVDIAVGTPVGSGRSEKALFTWFASRPIAQARAAVLCSLLPDTAENRADIRRVVLDGDAATMDDLKNRVTAHYGDTQPVVLDIFSGRGVVPLEAARAGGSAIGIDLSPLATLAGRLLADYPVRDWSSQPPVPIAGSSSASGEASTSTSRLFDETEGETESRLLIDVRAVLREVGVRTALAVRDRYVEPDRPLPWGYFWAVDMPCDACGRRFPLVGSLVLRQPNTKNRITGQWLRIVANGDAWHTEVREGTPDVAPTLTAPEGRRGKSARCPFIDCRHSHSLEVVKAKGNAKQFSDSLLAIGDRRIWRKELQGA